MKSPSIMTLDDLEDAISAIENTIQDYGFRIEQLELNTDLEDRIKELEDRFDETT